MKTTIFKLIFFISLLNFTHVRAEYDYGLEVRYAAFFPTSKEFRDACNFFGNCFEVEASRTIYDCYDGWVNFDWFNEKGKKNKFGEKTRIQIGNISCGITGEYSFNEQYTLYGGLGASVARVWQKNRSPFGDKTRHKFAYGGVAKVGLDYYVAKNVYLNGFCDYSYLPVHMKHLDDASGIRIGAGLGIKM